MKKENRINQSNKVYSKWQKKLSILRTEMDRFRKRYSAEKNRGGRR